MPSTTPFLAPDVSPATGSFLRRSWLLGGAAGIGAVGAAALSATGSHAAPVEFPGWATVTGTIPDDAGFDREAAEANAWTFSWSTDADGTVTFVYADGTSSASDAPAGEISASDAGAYPGGELTAQSTPSALWAANGGTEDPGSPAHDRGIEDLAAVVSAPFGGEPAEVSAESGREAPAPAAAVSDRAILDTAHLGLGGAYIWGGTEFMAWDCSGYVQWVYAQHGIEIPRVTWEQFAAGTPTSAPRPGDLVSQNDGSHVGIYLGGDQMISALNPEQGTIVHSVHAMDLDGYYTFR
ncbi:NlpC/P60 family protein [Kocuria coralli]|uniref:NlpC/P60 family protein n=1 Tax=Kocuria coralli TaxID=1461025 RepID=A0A5J5KY58_9MICC|nr:C40 family peptidase [Kocuria coralli]KAA9394707.1 NlpC/P60 family protein [Kocuria coralli]